MEKQDSAQIINLLQTIQQVMQNNFPVEQKLENAMRAIADFFGADFAASYISIDENYLTLFAKFGAFDISEEKNFRFGEGFVGEVAKTEQSLSTQNGNETGDGFPKFMMGAPLFRWDQVSGVVLIGYSTEHHFSNEQAQNLKTVAMFLTTVFSSEEISGYQRRLAKISGFSLKDRLKGIAVSKGYAIGPALVHRRNRELTQIFSADVESELALLEKARTDMIDNMIEGFEKNNFTNGEHAEIMQTYLLLAKDKGWYKKLQSHVKTGLTAEAAVEKAYEDMCQKMSLSADIYLKERLGDLRDISDRLRLFLNGTAGVGQQTSDDIVLVAQSMGAADLMDYDYTKIRALVLEEGTATMHVAIVAKALNIPLVAKVKGLFRNIKNGTLLAVDGTEGFVYVSPNEKIKASFQQNQQEQKRWREALRSEAGKKAKTLDKVNISLNLNIGLDLDMEYIKLSNCDGVGLYRTEMAFMSSGKLPTVRQQVAIYQKLLTLAKGKRVVFRSLDIGSDKLLPYWGELKEENPAIGWRSIRITLDRRALLREQMKAFLKASAGRPLDVMFPMISSLAEFVEAKETLFLEYEKQKQNKQELPTKLNVGLMIEVPSVLFELDEILKEADFISVGTNDLAQFVFACDRTNARLLDRYDVLSAPFLKVMRHIAQKANDYGVDLSVCGEMASNPVEAMALIGLGYRKFSMAGSSFALVKKMVRTINTQEITDYIESILGSRKKTLRPQLVAYAHDHAIAI